MGKHNAYKVLVLHISMTKIISVLLKVKGIILVCAHLSKCKRYKNILQTNSKKYRVAKG